MICDAVTLTDTIHNLLCRSVQYTWAYVVLAVKIAMLFTIIVHSLLCKCSCSAGSQDAVLFTDIVHSSLLGGGMVPGHLWCWS